MAEKSPAYLWYPADMDSSGRVRSLTDLEELWYRRMLDQSWMHEGIPADPTECAGWIGRNCTKESVEKLLKMFFVPAKKDPSKMVNPRQEEERKKLRAKSRLRKEAGRLSGVKRREQRDLKAEQKLNNARTKTNIPIPISITNKEEEIHTQADAWEYPVRELVEAFPNITLTPTMVGFIEGDVKPGDEKAWSRTLELYKRNYDPINKSYMPEKTGNLLSVFRKEKAALEKEKNGSNQNGSGKYPTKRTDADVIAESADFYDNYPA